MKGYFVTGTDTEVGKSLCAAGLLQALARQGYSTIGMKPVASGCERTAEGLRNEDAELLMAHMSVEANYEDINPHAFEPPMAPHLAAAQNNINIDVEALLEKAHYLASQADRIVIEGAGGWLTPLNETRTFADFAQATGLPVVLVVGIRLGCINHALLTYENLLARQVPVAGWIANTGLENTQNCLDIKENISALKIRLSVPFLGEIPYLVDRDVAKIAAQLHLQKS